MRSRWSSCARNRPPRVDFPGGGLGAGTPRFVAAPLRRGGRLYCAAGESRDTSDADGDGWSVVQGDCNDGNPSVHPGAIEACDGLDNDCDVSADESFPELNSPCSECGVNGTLVCNSAGDGVNCALSQTPGPYCGAPADIDGDGFVNPLTDTLLLLRWAFGFSGDTLISNAVDPDCSRCTAQAIIDHIEEKLLAVP